MHYFPLAPPFFLGLFLLFLFVVVLIELRVLQYAFELVGVDRRYFLGLLLASFAGSYINLPIAHLPPEQIVSPKGMQVEIHHLGIGCTQVVMMLLLNCRTVSLPAM